MKRMMEILTAAVCSAFSVSAAVEVVDAWHYDGVAYNSALNGEVGCNSTGTYHIISDGKAWPAKSWVDVTNEMVRFQPNYIVSEDIYLVLTPSDYISEETGKYQMEWDVVLADFSDTQATLSTNGAGLVQAGFRNSSLNIQTVAQLVYEGDGNQLVLRVVVGDATVTANTIDVHTFAGSSISNLHIRQVVDLDNIGSPGSFELYYTLGTDPEELAYSGVAPAGIQTGWLRLSASGNMLETWSTNDAVFVDNIVFTMLTPPAADPTATGLLEEWMFNDLDGTLLNGISNSAPAPYGQGMFGTVKPQAFTTNGVLRVVAGSSGTDNVFGNATLSSFNPPANNTYELKWTATKLDWSGGDTSGASFRIAQRVGAKNSYTVGFTEGVSKVKLDMRVGSTTTTLYNFGVNVVSNIHVRVVANYDTGTFDVYYTEGAGAETKVASNVAMDPLATNEVGLVRIEAITSNIDVGPTDFIEIDDLSFGVYNPDAGTPSGMYNDWLVGYPVGSSTNFTDNGDSDALNNLGEYAFGGDPSDPDDVGYVPFEQVVQLGGTNYIDYVYVRRSDYAARGLSYTLQLSADMAIGSWTNDISLYTVVGTGDLPGGGFSAVTNRVSADAGKRFIQTEVSYTP